MSDYKDSTKKFNLAYDNGSLFKEHVVEIDTALITGLRATGDHYVAVIPADSIVTDVKLIVDTAPTSSGSATCAVKVGSTTILSATAIASLTAKLVKSAADGIVVGSSDANLTFSVGTANLTAGAFKLYYKTCPVANIN